MSSIISRSEIVISPWVKIIQKEVQFDHEKETQIYHSVALMDYVTIVAMTSDGYIPLVRQYRPAVEDYTWELPAGLLEKNETTLSTCKRELLEEAGLEVKEIQYIGDFYTDTGRMENRQHIFFVKTSESNPDFVEEPGVSVKYVRFNELKKMIKNKEFNYQHHIAAVFLCEQLINFNK